VKGMSTVAAMSAYAAFRGGLRVRMRMQWFIVRTVVAMLGVALVCAGGCAPATERFEFTRLCMGVQTRVVMHAGDLAVAEQAAARAFAVIGEIEQALSDYRPDSEAMQLCAWADGHAGQWAEVGVHLGSALRASQRISAASEGAFSAAIGPAVKLWREARGSGRLPGDAERGEAVRLSDWRNVEVNESGQRVRVRVPGVRLDFGGIGKGYAAQAALEELKKRGFGQSMVVIAGDIAVGDAPPWAAGWRIDVGGPRDLLVVNAAVSTSGDTEQFVEINGKQYSHIVDVRTGLGFDASHRAQVTVVAACGAIADGLATALYAMPEEKAAALVERFEAAAILTRSGAGGEPKIETIDSRQRLSWVER